jgi:release factor glutamine methyltransferase
MVDRRVLIPRPETEYVVEVALGELDRVPESPDQARVAVDLGTGSGAIALSLAAERRRVEVWATDVSGPALNVARANLAGMAGYAATRVRLVEGHWWGALPHELRGRIHLVVSNPPYISTDEMRELDPQVTEWEPRSALEAGPSGLEAVEEILVSAPEWLAVDGAVVIELAPHQADQARSTATRVGFSSVEVRQDLVGRNRVLVVRA